MADGHEIHNELRGRAGTSFQIGVHNGPISLASSSNPPDIDEEQVRLLGKLAGEVRSASDRELERWGINDRDALPVRWHTAEEDLFDYWGKIHGDGTVLSLAGHFATIRQTYDAVESKRLVVLGRAGAGKTVLAHRLILDLLSNSGPVPVLFSLGDWSPAIGLRSWLAEHLVRDYPFLDTEDAATGNKLAEIFVNGGLIVPVLDGFDEIPQSQHPAAIDRISTVSLPLVVTSRPDEYARAVHESKAVGGAAAITLEDLTLDETEEYLTRSTSKIRAPAWESVFRRVRAAPDEPASRNLTALLTSPLMVTLSRTVYNGRDHEPGELLDSVRFPTSAALEDYLLGAYLDTLYDRRDLGLLKSNNPSWDPAGARHWLGHLATHLTQRNTHDLTWWQLPSTLHRHTRILATTATVGLVSALVAGLLGGIGDPRGIRLEWVLEIGLPLGFGIGLGAGIAVGLINELGFSRGRTGREPERLRLYLRRRGAPKRSPLTNLKKSASEFINGLVVGLAGGLVFGPAYGLVFGPRYGLGSMVAQGLEYGLVVGFMLGLIYGFVNVVFSVFGDSHDPHATDPWTLLTRDRKVTLVQSIASVLAAGLAVAVPIGAFMAAAGFADQLEDALLAGLLVGLMAGLVRLALSTWGSWLLFARLWLPMTGRLPWRPNSFLEDAYARGVLRRAGAVYQFRHARLRDHLAKHYRG